MSAKAVLIEWPQRIDDTILDEVIFYKKVILKEFGNKVQNHTPAYASLLLQFVDEMDFMDIRNIISELYQTESSIDIIDQKTWHIPVCYDKSLAVDIDSFSEKGISHTELVSLHTQKDYRVYMMGFLPGFLYLGGLSDRLFIPRKATPNLRTPKGAVAIGGEQTGIYPMESPGGWHVIGRTPLSLFDISAETPTPIRQGDILRFYEIDIKTYEVLAD